MIRGEVKTLLHESGKVENESMQNHLFFYILILFYLSRQGGENHTCATEILQVQTLLVQTLAANIRECDKKYKKATHALSIYLSVAEMRF